MRIVFVFLLIIASNSFAQNPYSVTYNLESGLPTSNIYNSFQDDKGYLWFATDVGVLKFNGYEFKHYNTDDGLSDNEVFRIFEDSKKRLWFLTLNGKLSYFKDGIIVNGKQSKVESLLGTSTSYETTEFFYHFKFDGLKLDFSKMENKPFIESFEILNNKVVLTVKNIAITIGDNISKLGEVNFSEGRNGAKSILYSTCEDCDVMINIEFDQTTNIITKISYFDMS